VDLSCGNRSGTATWPLGQKTSRDAQGRAGGPTDRLSDRGMPTGQWEGGKGRAQTGKRDREKLKRAGHGSMIRLIGCQDGRCMAYEIRSSYHAGNMA